jgi:tetratricopeptide (TPR) repeat protein
LLGETAVHRIVLLLAASAAYAGDVTVAARARGDFHRVEQAVSPRLSDAMACVQSQAALLPVAAPDELPRVHYRKAYCMLLEGVLRGDASEGRQAAREFEKALAAWPERTRGAVWPGLRILPAIAELKAGPEPGDLERLDAGLAASADGAACAADVLPAAVCRSVLETGRLWRGWIAQRQDRLEQAAGILREFPDSGWPSWVAGRQALEERRYAEAVPFLERAVSLWDAAAKDPQPFAAALLLPAPDTTRALEQLGQAQFLSGQYAAAIASFDACLQRQPRRAWTIFLRGRARDALGQEQAALGDYDLASRVALAQNDALFAYGDAHFYRGVWFFRRREFARAEDEFAQAVSSGPAARQADVLAWWRMAAVAGGACQHSTVLLETSLASVSDFFPRDEARFLIGSCRRNARSAPSHGTALCYSAG